MPEPTPDLVQRVLESIKTAADADYFFDHLTSTTWIVPLRGVGMFSKPPAPIRQGEFFQLPAWSASRYLVRMAPLAPEAVAETIRTIETTENGRVILDYVDAVIAMPDDAAAGMTDLAAEWVRSPFVQDLPTRVGDLIARLASAGSAENALKILAEVLHLELSTDEAFGTNGVRSRLRDWNYANLLETALPGLVQVDGLATLRTLSDILGSVVSAGEAAGRSLDEHSWIWRPAIEAHEQNHRPGPLDALISAIRDASELILRSEPDQLDTVLGVLNEHPSLLTKRLGLHLIRLFAPARSGALVQAITAPGQIGQPGFHHEYWHLLSDRFADLVAADQEIVLEMIAAGPHLGSELTEEDREARLAAWQRRYLAAIGQRPPPKWASRFAHLGDLADFPPHPDLLTYMTFSWGGTTSPLSADRIATQSVDETITFLSGWQSEEHSTLDGPSMEGLAREVTNAIATDPTRFGQEATRFIDLDPTYVRGALAGFKKAIDDDVPFDWTKVVQLASLVVQQPRYLERREERSPGDADPDWTWARSEVARLLAAGLGDGPTEIPASLREHVWAVLAVLVEDPQPDPEYESQYGGTNMDPTMLSLNTVRGQGFVALMDYLLWVRRDQQRGDDHDALASGFGAMPEVAEVLDRHLDPSIEPSAAIRSVYGRTLPWLLLVDEDWVMSRLPKLFPEDPDIAGLRDGAWDAYILYCRLYDSVFPLLREEYEKAVDRLPTLPVPAVGRNDVASHLADHLMMALWRGLVRLDDGIVQAFFEKADDATRAAAISFLGRGLEQFAEPDSDPTVQPPVGALDRLHQLWDSRLATAQAANQTNTRELRQFGWWYGSGVFTESWALTNLAATVRLAGSPEGGHKVLKQLRAAVADHPIDVLRALDAILRHDAEHWLPRANQDDVTTILESAMASNDPQAVAAATDLAHQLGAMGFHDYRSLLR